MRHEHEWRRADARGAVCEVCRSEKLECRCRGVELDGGCGERACRCWSELCCQCGDEYARRLVGALIG